MRERRTAIRQTIPVSSRESLFSKNSTNVILPEDQRSIANKLAREEKVRTYAWDSANMCTILWRTLLTATAREWIRRRKWRDEGIEEGPHIAGKNAWQQTQQGRGNWCWDSGGGRRRAQKKGKGVDGICLYEDLKLHDCSCLGCRHWRAFRIQNEKKYYCGASNSLLSCAGNYYLFSILWCSIVELRK